MKQKATTKDELFLLKLFQMASAKGDSFEEIDRYAVGKAVGLNERAIDNIVRHLAQANFVKKGDENSIYLTEQGMRLIETLKEG